MRGPLSGTTCAASPSEEASAADVMNGQMMNDCTHCPAHCSDISEVSSRERIFASVSSQHTHKHQQSRKQPLHLFLTTAGWALCLFILACIPPTVSAQPNGNDRRTNEDFLFDLANAPTVLPDPSVRFGGAQPAAIGRVHHGRSEGDATIRR